MLRISFVYISLLLLSAAACAKDALPIQVELYNGVLLYELDNERGDIEKLLVTLRTKSAPNQDVLDRTVAVVLASKQVTVADLQNLRSVLQQYGFIDIRFFTYWDGKERMTELTFGKIALPYTRDPRELKRSLERATTPK